MFSWERVGAGFMKHTGIPKLVLAVVLNGQFRKSTGLVRICSPYLFDWSTFEPLEPLNASSVPEGPYTPEDEGEFFPPFPSIATCGEK